MLWINGKRLIPAPTVTIGKSINYTQDGRALSSNYTINLNGTLLPSKGSPCSTGWYTGQDYPADEPYVIDNDQFNCLLIKQTALRRELSVTGVILRYEPTGYPPTYFYPRLQNINFAPGQWVIRSDYSIDLTANKIYSSGGYSEDSFGMDASGLYITSASDNLSINEREDGTGIRDINRTVSATSNTVLNSGSILASGEAWLNAKAWVSNRIATYPFSSGDSSIAFASGFRLNLVNNETIDKLGGTYSLNQRFIYHNANFSETRQLSKSYEYNLVGDGGPDFIRIGLNGTIQGYDPSGNVPAIKLNNALTYYNSVASGFPALVGAYGNPITVQVNQDLNQGSVQYTVNFVNASGNTYKHTYDVSYGISASTPQVTIAGQIEGVTPSTHFIDVSGTNKFELAASGWFSIKPNLKSLAFAYGAVLPSTGLSNFYSNTPLNKSISFNKPNGTISYNYTFGYAGSGNATKAYLDEYNVEVTSPNAVDATVGGLLVNANINGTLTGLNTDTNNDDPAIKYDNVKTAWGTVRALLFGRVTAEVDDLIGTSTPTMNSRVVNKTVGLNKINGIITYNFSYNNFGAPSDALVAVQDVIVEDVNSNDIFAVQIIPGRAVGPIIQNIGTHNEYRRNINVALTMYPNTGGVAWTAADYTVPRDIASGLIFASAPAGTRGTDWWIAGDTSSWNYKNGLYSRNISIVY